MHNPVAGLEKRKEPTTTHHGYHHERLNRVRFSASKGRHRIPPPFDFNSFSIEATRVLHAKRLVILNPVLQIALRIVEPLKASKMFCTSTASGHRAAGAIPDCPNRCGPRWSSAAADAISPLRDHHIPRKSTESGYNTLSTPVECIRYFLSLYRVCKTRFAPAIPFHSTPPAWNWRGMELDSAWRCPSLLYRV